LYIDEYEEQRKQLIDKYAAELEADLAELEKRFHEQTSVNTPPPAPEADIVQEATSAEEQSLVIASTGSGISSITHHESQAEPLSLEVHFTEQRLGSQQPAREDDSDVAVMEPEDSIDGEAASEASMKKNMQDVDSVVGRSQIPENR